MQSKLTVTTCLSPALFKYHKQENSIAVIIDIFRATTSICTAFNNGAKAIKTVAQLDDAKKLKENNFLVAAERNTLKCDFADFGNSPFDFTAEKVAGETIVFTTTNGTRAVEVAKSSDEIVIGAFSNFSKLIAYCQLQNKSIILVCAGWNNKMGMEDTLFAGAVAASLIQTGKFIAACDASQMSLQLWKLAKDDVKAFLKTTEHFQRLVASNNDDSINYCLQFDTCDVLPVYSSETDEFSILSL